MTDTLISKAELARQLGLSRTYVTLLAQGKRKPGKDMVDRLAALGLTANLTANTGMHEHTTFNHAQVSNGFRS
jgi:transcriptional regulator with XRE-family HTH domain